MRQIDRLSIFLFIFLFANAGCVSLKQPAPNIHTYAFDLLRPLSTEGPAGKKINLSIERFSIAEQFDSPLFVYRVGDYEYKKDYYHRFFAKPHVLLTQQTQAWFAQASYVASSHFSVDSSGSPDYQLKGDIRELYGDFRDKDQLKAVLTVQLVLAQSGQDNAVISKVYTRSIPITEKSATELMAAYNVALLEIFKEFEAASLGKIR